MNILEISNLNKKYKDFELKNINLTISAGFIFGFVGQNGAGKTSTINLINHICKFKQGIIRINGKTYEEDPVAYKESIAYIGDECYFPQKIKINSLKNTLADFYPTFDKPEISEIMLHCIKDRRNNFVFGNFSCNILSGMTKDYR